MISRNVLTHSHNYVKYLHEWYQVYILNKEIRQRDRRTSSICIYIYIPLTLSKVSQYWLNVQGGGRMRLKIEIYIHFESKEQLTMTYRKCLLYVFGSICIIFIKKIRGCCVKLEMCCICILEPKKADHTFCFSPKCIIGQRS